MRDVAIIGVGMHPWGKFDHKPLTQMCRESIEDALDAGVAWTEIEAVAPAVPASQAVTLGPLTATKWAWTSA
jgi:acetyl-CoA acetyltransferase